MKRNTKGILILLLAALVWGISFATQTKAADYVEPFTYNASRGILAFVFLLALMTGRNAAKKRRASGALSRDAAPVSSPSQKRTWTAGILSGAALFLAVNLQQAGISAYPPEAAAAGRSGFLTAIYVVLVALCARLLGKKTHALVYAATLVCLTGMYLLCVSDGFTSIYAADILTLICAVFFTCQILTVDHFTDVDGIQLSMIQFLVMTVLSSIAALLFEHPSLSNIFAAAIPILYGGIASSGIGYTLQIIGQKYTDAASASIAMSMESVFAALGGWILLNEHLTGRELAGCALVFAAVILAQLPSFFHRDNKTAETDLV